jgi:antitoxin component YwqK of YwqJK toxin-antitoxin module
VLSGPYRRYLDNGILEHACFYQGGQVCADYWPNGQPKHKTMKRGPLEIHEWYYPSGNVQKRFVAGKSGYAVEPVCLWYDNGQLAEEVHIKRGHKFGPWLKFFEDGSPRLQAEHRKRERLVVNNAWDDRRWQVVQKGRGTYFDDGLDIAVSYELIFKSAWTRSRELEHGIPHGVSTTWHNGVLWSRQEFADGKLHGADTIFYNNGRVRLRSIFFYGQAIKTEKFRKFDNPQPAVLLSVEANAELYEAWGEPLLDTYPTPRNLERIQAKLKVPTFLEEVFERNKSGELTEAYEDLNTFDDSIAYFATVNERGLVDNVEFSAASVYSGSTIHVYPPIIQQLKFEPGRIKGRKVRCRVVLEGHHTFVETNSQR